jgi:hypothetical protein
VLAGFCTFWLNEGYRPGGGMSAEAAIDRSERADGIGSAMTIETFNAIYSARLLEPEAENPRPDAAQAGVPASVDVPEPPVRYVRGFDSPVPTPDFTAPSVEDRNRIMIEDARLEQLSGRPGTITNPGVPDFDRMARDLNRALQGGTRQTRATPRSAPL